MFPNWTGWKTVKLVLGVVGAAAGGVAAQYAGSALGTDASIVGSVDASLLSFVVIFSGTALGPTVSK